MALEVIVTSGRDANGIVAGGIVVDGIRKFNEAKKAGKAGKEFFVLGLATGSSPLTTYEYIAKAANSGQIDMRDVVCFNLDEYIGLPGSSPEERKNHPEAYWRFMQENLFSKLKLQPHKAFIPRGFDFSTAELNDALAGTDEGKDYSRRGNPGRGNAIIISKGANNHTLCRLRDLLEDYSDSIAHYGGIDLQVIGSGVEGHAGFHEAGIPFRIYFFDPPAGTDMLLVELDRSTREKAVKDGHFKGFEESPSYALSMGNDLIFQAKKIVLLAHGAAKAKPILDGLRLPVTIDVPISRIQQHYNAVAVIDHAAAQGLLRQPYGLRFF